MTGIIRFILSLFIGVVIGIVLILINESLLILLSCGVIALFAAAFLYRLTSVKKELRGLLAFAGAIVAFFLYFALLNTLNDRSASILFPSIFFFGPFVAFIYVYTLAKGSSDNDENKDD